MFNIEEVKNTVISDIFKDSLEIKYDETVFTHYILISRNKKPLGFLKYTLLYDRIEIEQIFILEQFRNLGYAASLMDYLIKQAIKEKCINITLEVNEQNVKAISLYQKYGFEIASTRKHYYGNHDGYLMIKNLGENMNDLICLAIETSCDETSISIVKNGIEEISTIILSQIDIHKMYGGVVPEIASRKHVENITIVLEEALLKANLTMNDIDFIAVTHAPGLIGALLIGVMAAKTLAFIYNKPIVPVHHIAGHIYANNLVKRLQFPLIALVVSGGHTELILMEKDYNFKKIGGTLDDAAGEAYDKVGRILNLEYPAGPKIDKLAHIGNDTYQLPKPLDDKSYNFSFSGLKSAAINLQHNEKQKGNVINKENLATSFQNRVVNILVEKTMRALDEYHVSNLILAGGVAANDGLRELFTTKCRENNISLTLPEKKNCTDNAAMIGSAGYYAYLDNRMSNLHFKTSANEELM